MHSDTVVLCTGFLVTDQILDWGKGEERIIGHDQIISLGEQGALHLQLLLLRRLINKNRMFLCQVYWLTDEHAWCTLAMAAC